MTLILRAHVAAAAQKVVPLWPLDSFIAVNPLADRESEGFETVEVADVALTRDRDAYLSDLHEGRITEADLDSALRERIPELADPVSIGGTPVSATTIAILDMTTATWASGSATRPNTGLNSWLDNYLAAWLASYINPHPLWPMPRKEHGLYRAWRGLAGTDPLLSRSARRKLEGVPPEPDFALAWALEQLGIAAEAARTVLSEELNYLPGWVGHIKWRADKVGDVDLFSYLAVRFTVRAILGITPSKRSTRSPVDADLAVWERAERVTSLLADAQPSHDDTASVMHVLAGHPIADHGFTWQRAFERHYRAALLAELRSPDSETQHPERQRPQIQVVMCIDPRSEGIRRHLERNEGVATFGFAGFFGVPVRFARYAARGAIDSLPALLTPRHNITEHPTTPSLGGEHIVHGRSRDALRQAAHHADSSTATPFAFAETMGWFYGAISILRTFAPALHERVHRALVRSPEKLASTVTVSDAFSPDERAAIAETAIRMMGIADFGPLVVLAGHFSESTNNLYQSALDCGACGGNPGAANARAAASIFNDQDVRELLNRRGLSIPADTFFVAADHNTVTDVVTLLDRHLIPQSHREAARVFDELQHAAADQLVIERARDLPGASRRQTLPGVRRRAHDWAEVYPELGLAGNAAMIIGPRAMTRGVDLGRRVFLHSYDTSLDPDGTALETIMTAPLVVAQWINHQYYFSALNPNTLGAGTKTIHNAIDTIGVISGHSGDLRRGLPWQSVGAGTNLLHEPMRLAVIVEAPLDRVGEIVSRNQVLRNLFDNDWISLTARSNCAAAWHSYTQFGWKAATTTLEGPAA